MNKHAQSNQYCTTSFSKRFFVLIMLAIFLSSCGTVLQAPLPTQPKTESTLSEQGPATQKLTLVSPIEVATEMPTLTMTPEPSATLIPEPTATTTQDIDFLLPKAPQGIDPEKWREAYISGMQASGYLKLKVEAGLVEAYWDQKLNTMIWDLGDEKFGYNQEFGFTGDVVCDIYGKDWIVREKIFQIQSATNSIWAYDNLHIENKNELILGTQCTLILPLGSQCGIVGQIVGRDNIDLSKYLLDDYFQMSDVDKGLIYKMNQNFMTEILRVRVPSVDGYVEVKVPVCPVNYCDSVIFIRVNDTSRGHQINTGNEFLNTVKSGELIYMNYGIITDEQINKDRTWSDDDRDAYSRYFWDAFGNGKLSEMIMKKYFNTGFGVSNIPDNYDGTSIIFNLDKMVDDMLIDPMNVYLK